MSREILEAVRGLAAEKNISSEKLMEALEDALLSAYKKTPGAARHAKVEMDRESGDFKVYELKIPPEIEAQVLVDPVGDQEPTVDPETGELREPPEPELDMEKLKEFEDQIEIEDVTPDDFGRIAAQTAKQVILQRIREAERDMMFEEYRDRVGELITGIVQQSDSRYTLVQLRERVEALLPKSEQVDGERYDHSQRIKAVIKDVSNSTKGPSIIVSRRDPELIKQLFELEVPEIADGLVEITGVAREPGYRSKIAVVSHVDGVDPVGACVGSARLPRADGRLRAAWREDRHHPLQRRAGPVRGQGAVAGARPRGAGRRRRQAGHGDRPRRPAFAGHRPRGTERAARRPADRLANRHPLRDRVRRRGGRARLRGGGDLGPLPRDPGQRPPLSERGAPGLTVLRAARAPGARGQGHRRRRRGAGERRRGARGRGAETPPADGAEASALRRPPPSRSRAAVDEAPESAEGSES